MDLVDTSRVLDAGVKPNHAATDTLGDSWTVTSPSIEAHARPQWSEISDDLGPARGIGLGLVIGAAVWLCLILGASALFVGFAS